MLENSKIAIIGGSFNPPTYSHMVWGSEIWNLGVADKIIYVPCGERDNKVLEANNQQRLDMLNIYVKNYFGDNGNVTVSDIEIKNKKTIPTYFLLNKFEEIFKNDKIYFVIGSDLIDSMSYWDEYERLYNDKNFIIFNRTGYPINNLPPNSFKVNSIMEMNLSSTNIRKRIKEFCNTKYLGSYGLLDIDVIKYIKEKKIYFN